MMVGMDGPGSLGQFTTGSVAAVSCRLPESRAAGDIGGSLHRTVAHTHHRLVGSNTPSEPFVMLLALVDGPGGQGQATEGSNALSPYSLPRARTASDFARGLVGHYTGRFARSHHRSHCGGIMVNVS